MIASQQPDSQGYKYYSIGRVVEHKQYNSNIIEVAPIDKQPFQAGPMVADVVEVKSEGRDSQGKAYSASMQTSKSITATWKGDGTNRTSAPDVRRGDEVILYTLADTEKFYWTVQDSDNSRRRQEHVEYRYSATDDEKTKELDDDNSYTVTYSPKLGLISMKTAAADGGEHSHFFQMNTKDGIMTMGDKNKDGGGRHIELNIKEDKVTVTNGSDTYIIQEGKVMKLSADDLIDVKAKDQKFTSETSTVTSQKTRTVETLNYSLTATAQATFTSAMIDLAAPLIKFGTFGTVTNGAYNFAGTQMTIESAQADIASPNLNITSTTVTMSATAAEQFANNIRPYL